MRVQGIGIGKAIKYSSPRWASNALRVAFNRVASTVPVSVKYGLAQRLHQSRYPYRLIEPGDLVVQVGAPRDILRTGRSRAVNFMCFGARVVVVEPDPNNVAALQAFVARHGLTAEIVPLGAWKERDELVFLSSPDHPAANVLESAARDGVTDARRYERTVVPVDTLDSILGGRTPKLVSITTNGAESEILAGMRETIARGVPYISLALTGSYTEEMGGLGYEVLSQDDRGHCFRRR